LDKVASGEWQVASKQERSSCAAKKMEVSITENTEALRVKVWQADEKRFGQLSFRSVS